jgi:CheY-like chemotaxis protein
MADSPKTGNVTLLVAEDDDGHAELIRELLEEVGLCNPILRFRDGQEVLDFLAGDPRPKLQNGMRYLMLLDIRMPRVNGVEVLRRMKGDPRLKDIPVIMLTTSDSPREVQECYHLGCNCYITKPVQFGKFAEVLRQLGLFLMIVHVPKLGPGQG